MTIQEKVKALRCCADEPFGCNFCPLYGEPMQACNELYLKTADLIESMAAELDTIRHKLEQTESERDTLLKEVVGTCHVCKNEETDKYADCHFNVYAWNTHEDHWQWRGQCAENGGTGNGNPTDQ